MRFKKIAKPSEVDLNIVGAKLLIGNQLLEGGISIEEGKIIKIGKEPSLPKADIIHDVKGLLAIPGLIDSHVHLRDLQLSYKEDFYTGTCAAAAGGFTTILDMPNNIPPTYSAANLRLRRDEAITKVIVNVGFHAGLVDDKSEIRKMSSMGVYSFKLYMNRRQSQIDFEDDAALVENFSTCKMINAPITVHAEDGSIIKQRMNEFKGKPIELKDYSYIHDLDVEEKAVDRIIEIEEKTGATIHICHISNSSTINKIEKARDKGMPVTGEITPHHMILSNNDLEKLGGWALMDPPLRKLSEVENLWNGLSSKQFLTVASDHAPHSLLEKSSQDIREITPGIPGLETTVPILLTKVSRGMLSLSLIPQILAERPAKIFGLKGKGELSEGADADITILDLEKEFVIDPEKFHSKARYSPFAGENCVGGVSKVFLAGEMIFENGEIFTPPGSGQVLGVQT
ncbi:dihydroorotase [[Eubacterium] cellulosolvens]